MSARTTTRAGARTVRRRVLAMTDSCTALAHLVTDEAMAAGRRTGRYRAACDAVVLACSLKQEAQDYCRPCARWVAGP